MIQTDDKASNYELSAVPGVSPRGIVTLYYIGIKKSVREFAWQHEGVAKHIIG